MATSPPTGTLTFLFTDIEGSTKMWERDSSVMQLALARHDEILRSAIEERGGYVFKTVGDAFCCAFLTAPDALEAALEAQRRLLSFEWEQIGSLKVRIALHTGAAEERDEDYFGSPVNRVARLLSAAHGGQVLLSAATHEMLRDQLPAGAILMDLGEHRLKDLFRPERVFQLTAPGLTSEFPPLRTLEGRPNNLPLQSTPLIGREGEVGEVVGRVRSEGMRLLTLTGPGGTGKTRLALQAAADLLDDFEDGVFFVALATVTDPQLVPSAIAGPLGVRESGDRPLTENLEGHLKEKRLLLILDNFEQVLEGASVVGELAAACPDLEILATSRVRLGLYGEKEYAVPPLSVPDVKRLPDLKTLTQYEALRLFVERAKSAKVDFEVNDESAPAVAEICVRLDGLPLAIELAAARVKMLPPRAMLHRLGSRLKLLTGGARDLPERQRTLRATIEWSHALLDEGEQLLFGRLAVFSGGRTLEAIEAVCDAGGDLPMDSFEGVSSLVDKNLLRQEEGADGEPRFYMLETVHEFAREKLEGSAEAEQVRRRHALFFLSLAEEAEPSLRRPEDKEWLERLEEEHDNLRAALAWVLDRGEPELGLRLAGALWLFWQGHGHYSEGRKWLEEALRKDDRASAASRVKALDAMCAMAIDQWDLDRAEAAAQEGLTLSTEADIGSSLPATFLTTLGIVAWSRGESERAKEFYEDSLALSREADDKIKMADALLFLGYTSSDAGDNQRAKELFEEGIALCRNGDYPYRLFDFWHSLGYILIIEGDYERGAALNEEAAELYREHGYEGGLEFVLGNLGLAALLQGNHERARTSYEEGLMLSNELGNKLIVSESLEGLACICAAEGETERAARLFGATQALRDTVGLQHVLEEDPLRAPYLAMARLQAGETAWEALAQGRAMGLEQAVSYALEGEDDAGA